jgi:transcriptional regulator with XRE-family HTH domain
VFIGNNTNVEVINLETLGQRLRQFRMKKGITQSQLAKGIVTPSMVSQIESGKAKPSYQVLEEIAHKLDISLDELIGNVELNMRIESEYRLAKSMMSAGEYSGALSLLEKVVTVNEGRLDPFEIRYDMAYCRIQLNQLRDAESAFKQCLEYVGITDIQTVRVLQQLGDIELRRKRYQIGEYYLTQALERLNTLRLKDSHLQANLLLLLGNLQEQSGQLQKSFVTYRLALPIFEERQDIEGLGNLYMQLAQSAHQADQYEQVSEYAQRAQWCFEEFQDQLDKLELELRHAVLQSEIGDRDDAILEMERIVSEYRRKKCEEEMGVAMIELAKAYLASGKLDLAVEYSQSGRAHLPTIHLYQAWGARVQAGVAHQRNQQAVAVKYMKQAAECFKLLECQAEYEETMQELSRLHEAQDDCQSALRVMREMWSDSLQVRRKRGFVL